MIDKNSAIGIFSQIMASALVIMMVRWYDRPHPSPFIVYGSPLNLSKLRNDEMVTCLKKARNWATCVHKSEALLHSCSSMDKAQYCVSSNLTHWDQDNLTAILQTTFSNSFLLRQYWSIGPKHSLYQTQMLWRLMRGVSNCHALLTTPQFNCILANNG